MLGLIHKTLFNLIESVAGSDALLETKRRAGVPADKTFRMDEPYDDVEWQRLLDSTCQVLGITPAQAEQAFAEYFGQDAVQRWSAWFAMSHNAREFLERHPKIHNSFATGVRDPVARKAIVDKFSTESRGRELVIHYASPNQLCGLYMALARWVINHYGEQATVEETRCCKRGDAECEVHICWPESGDQR